MSVRKLGELLLAEGLVDAQSLSLANTEALARQRKLAEIVIDLGLIEQRSLAALLAKESGLELVSPIDTTTSEALAGRIPVHVARLHQIVPVRAGADAIVIAMIDPFEPDIVELVAAATGARVERAVGVRSEIELAVLELYGGGEPGGRAVQASGGRWVEEGMLPAPIDDELPKIPEDWLTAAAGEPGADPAEEGATRDADKTAPSTAGRLTDSERLAHVERQLFSVTRALALIQTRLDTFDARLAHLGSPAKDQK